MQFHVLSKHKLHPVVGVYKYSCDVHSNIQAATFVKKHAKEIKCYFRGIKIRIL